jgi:hypothetical protein
MGSFYLAVILQRNVAPTAHISRAEQTLSSPLCCRRWAHPRYRSLFGWLQVSIYIQSNDARLIIHTRDDERSIAWDFTPPFSMGLFGRGPGLKTSRSWERREVHLDVWDWSRWLHVEMKAPSVILHRPQVLRSRVDITSGHIYSYTWSSIQGICA